MRAGLIILASLAAAMALFALLFVIAVVVGWIVLSLFGTLPEPDRQWPRMSVLAIVGVPVLALVLAFLISRRAEGRTFYAQQSANRWISLLLILTIIGLLVGLGEIIAAAITFDAYGALAGAGLALFAGVGAAAFAHFAGPGAVLASSRARPADTAGEGQLLDVVREISIAANLAPPKVYVIEDPSLNAMAVGTRADNSAVAVTRGLLDSLDREQLQGVVAHEIGHIRNLDSRYGVYVAILVGLVALVTDGFLRTVVRAWQEGVFLRGGDSDDAKGMIAGLAAGVAFGLLLLGVALVLRVFAPIASLLVQAAVSRQREYFADATSVELTRNPASLSRALDELRGNQRPLSFANRGSQHLWFNSPLGHSDDVGWHLFATHPTLDARIARLHALYPQSPAMGKLSEMQAEG